MFGTSINSPSKFFVTLSNIVNVFDNCIYESLQVFSVVA